MRYQSSASLNHAEDLCQARGSTEEQIIARILKEAETAPTVGEVIRRHGVTPKTYHRWKAKFAGMGVSVVRAKRQRKWG